MAIRFAHRQQAGEFLASKLTAYAHHTNVLVLALPRGGVPVGFALASILHVPLDIFLVRKLGVPGQEELAMGAIASGGVQVLNTEVINILQIPREEIDLVAVREREEIERREHLYRDSRPPLSIRGRTVILVDDGLATGATMRAAIIAVRYHQPRHLVVAVPTAASETCAEIQAEADEVVCASTPEPFHAVGMWYADFTQVTDEEVREFLSQAALLHYPTTSSRDETFRVAQ